MLDNWLSGFLESLKKHMKNYSEYLKSAKAEIPGKFYKFIFLIEDTGTSIIDGNCETNLNILSISEFIVAILQYSQIDGVITYKENPLGILVSAKDRQQMKTEHSEGTLRSLKQCSFSMLIEEIIVSFTPDEQKQMQKTIARILCMSEERFGMIDEISVFKYNSRAQDT